MFGRQAEQLQEAREFAGRTLELLRSLKSGAVLPSALVVTENSWHVQEESNGEEESTEAGSPAG